MTPGHENNESNPNFDISTQPVAFNPSTYNNNNNNNNQSGENIDIKYHAKYLKYKNKYLQLRSKLN